MILLSGSPRRGGNSDAAAALLREGLADEGVAADVRRVSDGVFRSCMACGRCEHHPGRCVLDEPGDDTAAMFETLRAASALLLVLPVYFYGPPAQCKALMDRAQVFWWQGAAAQPHKPLFVVQVAARTGGQRLFEANGLIGRCFARTMGFAPLGDAAPADLLLPGLDGRDALRNDPIRCDVVRAHGRAIGRALAASAVAASADHA